MKIAVVGAGFTGCSIALKLSDEYQVTLFEKEKDILLGASAYNQMRFHYGYHYPRSQKTIDEIKVSKNDFLNFYGKSIFDKTKNFYSIPFKKSKTNPKDFEKFLKKNNLYFKEIKKKNFLSNNLDKTYEVNEKILNYFTFKKKIKKMLKKTNVKIKVNSEIKKSDLTLYDKVIVATYSSNNTILKNLGIKIIDKFRYELIEKIVIKLPTKYKNRSFVVIDGDFVCCDPYLGTPYHLLSDVLNSKIKIIKKKFPNFNLAHKKFINKIPRKRLDLTRYNDFIKKSSYYLPFLKKAKYIKSMYTIRTLKLNKEKTDERTNYLKKINNKIFVVLTGKWNTSMSIAIKINKLFKQK